MTNPKLGETFEYMRQEFEKEVTSRNFWGKMDGSGKSIQALMNTFDKVVTRALIKAYESSNNSSNNSS